MRVLRLVPLLALTLGIALLGPAAAGAQAPRPPTLVLTVGSENLVPNSLLISTFKFAPGEIQVHQGDQITWQNQTDAPHTASLVRERDLPTTFLAALQCSACAPIRAAHLPGGGVRVPVLNAGAPGFDTVGDSVLFFPGQSATVTVSAAAGTELYYLCALHPWMQGEIHVS